MSTAMIWQTNSTGSDDTERLGELLGKQLRGGEVIELRADLGGGKTTFVKGLVRGADGKNRVVSPTFTLSRIYRAKDLDIYHFDFYRLNDPGILAGQLAEAINDNAVVVVEWSDIVKNVLPERRISIEFEPTAADPNERRIIISYPEQMEDVITQLESQWQTSRP